MPFKVYIHRVEPEKYPEFSRRSAKAVTREMLDNKIQFTSLRGFPSTSTNIKDIGEAADMGARPLPDNGSKLREIEETIDLYVNHFRLGKVLWPVYPTLFAGNFKELVDICSEKGLYLYDFWGYVPGSKPATGIWGEYSIPESTDSYMKKKLGDRFLGYDNGEQDGRYIHASAEQKTPVINDRKTQYRQFQEYFERLNDAMMNHTVTLSSLTFLHYFAKEGNTIMIGAETAQALPSNPMWFSFIRGASKQYGLLCYGNASVWNRWGYKDYAVMDDEPDRSPGYERGRTGGTSLSLLRRLIYNQYMYGCDILGFEGSWFTTSEAKDGDKTDDDQYLVGNKKYTLTPVGLIQRYCADFVGANGSAGIHYAPLAIIADFFSGWVPPRHLYTSAIYRAWGNQPYNNGDYTLDCLFSMLYPGYENSGFFRDERGFMTPTPYGEIADVLLSDVRSEILSRYQAAVILPNTHIDNELYDKIVKYIESGGRAVVFSPECGCDRYNLFSSDDYRQIDFGNGKLTVIRTPLEETEEKLTYENVPDKNICHPYRLSPETESCLSELFDSLRIIYVDNRKLQYTLAVKNENEYTLFVSNNTLTACRFNILSSEGKIISVSEHKIDDGVTGLPEFLPRNAVTGEKSLGDYGEYEIKPYDFRMFAIKTEGIHFDAQEEKHPVFSGENLYLALSDDISSAKDYLLSHPTYSHHFGGIKLPAEYLDRISDAAAEKEAHYFRLQGIKIIVDFTRMLDHVPNLTIIGNFPHRTENSVGRIISILDKAEKYGCSGAVFAFHRNAENEYSVQKAKDGSVKVLKRLNSECEKRGIKQYIINRNILVSAEELFSLPESCNCVIPAYSTCFAICGGEDIKFPESAGMLILSDAMKDRFGQVYPINSAVSGSIRETELVNVYRYAKEKGVPVVLDPGSSDFDTIYNELKTIKEII